MIVDRASTLIVGGGIVGLSIARALALRGKRNILVIEKEDALGRHASGRNSGVLHSGIYYTSDTLKARFCHDGNLRMKAYVREHGLPLLETGKVVVAKNEDEIKTLQELYRRGMANGAVVELIDEVRLKEIEPEARTYGLALYSADTAVVDPKAILESIREELTSGGAARIMTGVRFQGVCGSSSIRTNAGEIGFDMLINASGAHSEGVAHAFGVGLKYCIIPFKGVYKKLSARRAESIRGSIYPVPDIRNPFLGVHFTRGVHGSVYVGPTAMPSFGRENYGFFSGMSAELPRILAKEAVLFIANQKFRNVALTETRKYIPRFFFKDAAALVRNLQPEDLEPSNKAGIRPQLVDWDTKQLVNDFIVLRDGSTVHVLNAISPAFTSALPFADYVLDNYCEVKE